MEPFRFHQHWSATALYYVHGLVETGLCVCVSVRVCVCVCVKVLSSRGDEYRPFNTGAYSGFREELCGTSEKASKRDYNLNRKETNQWWGGGDERCFTWDTLRTTSPLTTSPWTKERAATNVRVTIIFIIRGMSPKGRSVSICLDTQSK